MNEVYVVKLETPIQEERLLEFVSLDKRKEIQQFSLQAERIWKLAGQLLYFSPLEQLFSHKITSHKIPCRFYAGLREQKWKGFFLN